MSPEPFFQQLYEDKVEWRYMVNASETIENLPYKLLKKPQFSPSNIKVIHPEDRSRGHKRLKRQTSKLEGVLEFSRTGKASLLYVQKPYIKIQR